MQTTLKLTALAGAVALALGAGQASATINPMSGGNSEVWFSIWDPIRSASYTRDLGFLEKTLTIANTATQTGVIENTGNLSMQFGPDALLTQFLNDSAANLGSLQWNVAGGDGSGASPNTRNIIVTAAQTVSQATIQALVGQQLNDMITAANSYVSAVTGAAATLGSTHGTLTSTNGSSIEVVNDSLGNDSGYAGGAFWGQAFGSNANFVNATGLGGSLNFWNLINADTNNTGSAAAGFISATQFLGLGGVAQWTLATDGTLTFAAVPEAETWALLGLGLLGAGAVARRRSRALA
jgi:hypothetical protein